MLYWLIAMVIAPRISFRRLLAFFATVYFVAWVLLVLLGIDEGAHRALVAAAGLTIIAWALPLFRIASCVVRGRRGWRAELRDVSLVVQLTYVLAPIALALYVVEASIGHRLMLESGTARLLGLSIWLLFVMAGLRTLLQHLSWATSAARSSRGHPRS